MTAASFVRVDFAGRVSVAPMLKPTAGMMTASSPGFEWIWCATWTRRRPRARCPVISRDVDPDETAIVVGDEVDRDFAGWIRVDQLKRRTSKTVVPICIRSRWMAFTFAEISICGTT